MDKPIQKFPVGGRVKLRDGVDPSFYGGYGLPGNEGWIRSHHTEDMGYHRVFVEWDKNSWSYNGAPDGWTWENHFELVEEDHAMADKESKDNVGLRALLEEFIERLDLPAEEVPDDEEDSTFEETLDRAFEDAVNSKAFVVVTLNEQDMGEMGDIIVPSAYHAAHDKQSSLVCQMQLGELAQQFSERLVNKELGGDEG